MRYKILSGVLLINLISFAQDPATPERIVSISDWSVLPVTSHDFVRDADLGDFQQLSPDGGISDLPVLPGESLFYSFRAIYLNPAAHASIGLKFFSKKKGDYLKIPAVRLGLTYSRITPLTGRVFYMTTTPLDTLVSNQTGDVYYLDSVRGDSYWMNYSSNTLRLDVSFLARFRSQKRFSFFAGVGFSAGIGINSKTRIEHNTYGERHFRNETESSSSLYFFESSLSTQQNKLNFNGSVYFPFGLDFRLGNKSDLGKRSHLFYEMRVGVNFISIPELRTVSSANFQQGLGFRFEL